MYLRAVKWLFQSSFFFFDRNALSLEWLSDELILKRAHKVSFLLSYKIFLCTINR